VPRGRPKGSKNKPKPLKPPKDEPGTFKYANAAYKERDPERELDKTETMFLIARYQETGGSIKKAARFVCCSDNRARETIMLEADRNPRILTDPTFMLGTIIALREIQQECLDAYRKFLKRDDHKSGRLVASASFAGGRADAMAKAYAEAKGAEGAASTEGEAQEAIDGVDEELRLLESGAGNPEPQDTEAETETDNALAQDAGQGDE
jgi:hypothetical protein